jgi:hypothetical protein
MKRSNSNILEQSRDDALGIVVPLLLPLCLDLGDRLPALFRVGTGATDVGKLPVAHARVKIDVSGADKERSVGWDLEPRPDLPDKVEEDDERNGKAVFEEDFGVGACTNRLLQTGQPGARMCIDQGKSWLQRNWVHKETG